MRLAFGHGAESSDRFVARVPIAYQRVWGRPPLATIVLIPMGHFFGGRRVSSVGVQAVAVGPEARGAGLARDMMAAALREMHASGAAISTLYASVQSLYRQVGYEHAGVYAEISVNLRMLPRRGAAVPLRALGPEADAALVPLQRRFAALQDGAVDRDPYLWARIRQSRGMVFDGFGLPAERPDGALDGYFFACPSHEAGHPTVTVSDLAFRSAAAGRRLLRALGDFAPVLPTALIGASVTHPVATLLDQQWHEWRIRDVWLLRVVSLRAAIEERGYRQGVSAEFRLEVEDDVLGENSGTWVVEIAGGRGRLRRPTRADSQALLRVGPRGLAAIWSGFLTPRLAQLQELADGPDEALSLAEAAFAGPTASMIDRF